MKRNEICSSIVQAIKQYIDSPDCMEIHRAPSKFIRMRKLSFQQVILYLLYSSKASMNQNLAMIRQELISISFPDITKQALSKARQFIHPYLFRDLFNISVDIFYRNIGTRKDWHGYHLFAIDGSKIELPNSKSNFEHFGEMFGYPDSNRKFTMALASTVYDVLEDYIVHASINRYLAGERAVAIEHLKTLEALRIYENAVVIFDRGYYSEGMFRYCVEHNHLCVMRLRENFKLSKNCKGETLTTLPGNLKENTYDIDIRVIEVSLDDGSKEYLATNIFDKSITAPMFKELYFKRWPIEIKYHELKSSFKLEEFNGATPVAIMQEFFINLMLSNIASLIKNHVDELIDETSNPANKYRYQANRSFIIGQLKYRFARYISAQLDLNTFDDLIALAYKNRSQIQPGRSFARKRNKAIGRTHFRNKKVAF